MVRLAIVLCVLLLLGMNYTYIIKQQEPGYWVLSGAAIISIIALCFTRYKSDNHSEKASLQVWIIVIAYLSGWIIFGINNGYDNLSLIIYHGMLILVTYYITNTTVGKWLFLLGSGISLLSYQFISVDFLQIVNYLFITFSAVAYSEHVRTIMESRKHLSKKVDELETLYAITKVLDSFPDLDSVLRQITRIVTYGLDVDVCGILMYSQETGELELQSRFPDDVKPYSISPEIGIAGEVFRTGQPIICGNLNNNIELLDRIAFKNDENAVCMFPLEHHGDRFGVLLFTKKESIDLDSGLQQVMQAVASTVSMVISNAMHHETVVRSTHIDELTGLHNRAYFYDVLDHEVRKAKFTGQSVYVLVLDIDKFKAVNDTYGHIVGDQVLEKIGHIISSNTRKSDVGARYGGEEFALILPNSCYTAAEHLAERIRRGVEKITIDHEEFSNFSEKVTLSVGIACYPHCAGDPKRIVDIADKRMYAAKRTGGNQYLYE